MLITQIKDTLKEDKPLNKGQNLFIMHSITYNLSPNYFGGSTV